MWTSVGQRNAARNAHSDQQTAHKSEKPKTQMKRGGRKTRGGGSVEEVTGPKGWP